MEAALIFRKHAYNVFLLTSGIRNEKTAALFKTPCEVVILFFSQAEFQVACGEILFILLF